VRIGELKVGQRLGAIAEQVPCGSRVVDVGSGHGLLPRILLASGRSRSCIATEPTWNRLARIPQIDGLERRAGFGLGPLDSEDRLDVAVLAGMGARTIVKVLSCDRRRALGITRFVLQPQTEPAMLRRWLLDHELAISQERLVEEGRRRYLVLSAEPRPGLRPPQHPRLSLDDLLEVGPRLVGSRDPVVRKEWEDRVQYWGRLVRRASGECRSALQSRLAQGERVLAALAPSHPLV
jgi:tRNA (adenine22-N1)-methyltransferase